MSRQNLENSRTVSYKDLLIGKQTLLSLTLATALSLAGCMEKTVDTLCRLGCVRGTVTTSTEFFTPDSCIRGSLPPSSGTLEAGTEVTILGRNDLYNPTYLSIVIPDTREGMEGQSRRAIISADNVELVEGEDQPAYDENIDCSDTPDTFLP